MWRCPKGCHQDLRTTRPNPVYRRLGNSLDEVPSTAQARVHTAPGGKYIRKDNGLCMGPSLKAQGRCAPGNAKAESRHKPPPIQAPFIAQRPSHQSLNRTAPSKPKAPPTFVGYLSSLYRPFQSESTESRKKDEFLGLVSQQH